MSDQTSTKPAGNPYSDEAQHEQVEWNLTNHTPSADQVVAIEHLRAAAKLLSHTVIDLCPSGPDRTLALRKIEEGTMMAVASIARQR